MSDDITVETVDGSRAADVLAVIHEAFANRPPLDPPATALDETLESVREALDAHGGLLVEHDGQAGRRAAVRAAGAAARAAPGRRARSACGVSAWPPRWRRGPARSRQERGFSGLELEARVELPETIDFWRNLGYVESEPQRQPPDHAADAARSRSVLETAEDTRAFGEHLGHPARGRRPADPDR